MEYRLRIVDKLLENKLKGMGAVLVEGGKVHHSGAGRIAWLKMRPMSLWESGDSNGQISMEALFGGVEDLYGVNLPIHR